MQMVLIALSIAPLYVLPLLSMKRTFISNSLNGRMTLLHTQNTESDEHNTPLFSPLKLNDLIGHTFLTTTTEDDQHFC